MAWRSLVSFKRKSCFKTSAYFDNPLRSSSSLAILFLGIGTLKLELVTVLSDYPTDIAEVSSSREDTSCSA
jgi:hypothetical protein